ncbi:MAG: hypothetical protein HQK53_07440 [Oligoflexia bacterium]|nr:hypothetical protein [Oligoflexia bacterium]
MKTVFAGKSKFYILSFFLIFFPLLGKADNFSDRDLLSAIANTEPNKPLKIDPSVKPDQVLKALQSLHGKLKIKEGNPSKLDVDAEFSRSFNAEHKKGFDKLSKGLEQRVREGVIKVVRDNSGKWSIQPGNGKNEGRGVGHEHADVNFDSDEFNSNSDDWTTYHSTGNGWWSWSTSYSWWGVKVSLNHNYLWYLCKYTSWMLSTADLPGWIEYVLSKIACLPHSCDSGYNGSAIYITWAGAFWYSC